MYVLDHQVRAQSGAEEREAGQMYKADNEDDRVLQAWLLDVYSQISRSYVFGPSGFWTMAPLRYAAKFDPFLTLDCAPTPLTLAQSKERKG